MGFLFVWCVLTLIQNTNYLKANKLFVTALATKKSVSRQLNPESDNN